ncbi:unnamed protein product, partial [marine sediment metagenome]
LPIGQIIVDEANTAPLFVASGEIDVSHQHGGPVFWNRTTNALSANAGDHGFNLTPLPEEIQDAP